MMNPAVLIVTMMYAPEPTGFSPIVTDLAGYLAAEGWRPTVVTAFPQAPYWRVYDAYKGRLTQRETIDSVQVRRGWVYVPKMTSAGSIKVWKRVLFDTSLAATAMLLTLGLDRPDVVVIVSPPLQAALPAILLNSRWHTPTLLWIQDIVPDAAVSTGMMREGLWLGLARRFEQFVYKNVAVIGVIAPGFERNLRVKGVSPSKIVLLPNWANMSQFRDGADGQGLRRELGYRPEDFVLVHAGSVAAKQCLENAVRAIHALESASNVHLLVVGDGNRMGAVMQEAERLGVSRARFMAPVANARYGELLRAADALLLNQCKDVTDVVIPSKLLSYLPSGRPVIAAVHSDSEAARFLREAQCALIVRPEDPRDLARGIETLKDNSGLRRRLGAAGISYSRGLDRDSVLQRFSEILSQLAVSGALTVQR
jgi:colanic acid biosynthesis glycosyl transferase WcaI